MELMGEWGVRSILPQKIPHTGDTDSLRVDNPEGNAGTIHASNPEHLLVLKALRGDNPEQNAGTIQHRTRGRSTQKKFIGTGHT